MSSWVQEANFDLWMENITHAIWECNRTYLTEDIQVDHQARYPNTYKRYELFLLDCFVQQKTQFASYVTYVQQYFRTLIKVITKYNYRFLFSQTLLSICRRSFLGRILVLLSSAKVTIILETIVRPLQKLKEAV